MNTRRHPDNANAAQRPVDGDIPVIREVTQVSLTRFGGQVRETGASSECRVTAGGVSQLS
jgi:hypothetical protein